MKPLALDLCCGLGGWTHALLAEGWDVIGFDIERHEYGGDKYPGKLIIQDVLTLDGSQFKGVASLVAASPPCVEFSYMAMPWSRGKQIANALRGKGEFPKGYKGSRTILELTALFDACVRIGREAGCPTIIENVRGAQPWVGRAKWAFGSYYLWGDVPALMPITQPRRKSKVGSWDQQRENFNPDKTWDEGSKNNGGSWFNIGSPGQKEVNRNPVHELAASGFKATGMNWSDQTKRGQDFTRIAGEQFGVKVASEEGRRTDVGKGARFTSRDCGDEGKKSGHWFGDGSTYFPMAMMGSKSNARKAASALIAKIPYPLALHIAKVFKPKL